MTGATISSSATTNLQQTASSSSSHLSHGSPFHRQLAGVLPPSKPPQLRPQLYNSAPPHRTPFVHPLPLHLQPSFTTINNGAAAAAAPPSSSIKSRRAPAPCRNQQPPICICTSRRHSSVSAPVRVDKLPEYNNNGSHQHLHHFLPHCICTHSCQKPWKPPSPSRTSPNHCSCGSGITSLLQHRETRRRQNNTRICTTPCRKRRLRQKTAATTVITPSQPK
ncbi:hypothetical protein DEO72_LG10g1876 [Vigna unguiculata]|uniref:Uncharacterized protein n=1 Tax=Vigna unguiculata TaxID=3917 RepID=A0A4D6NEN0_VIGUN|nr:hypothetical protein DEO72_LG10g1876 [Vigna unguiculata]